MTHVQIGYALIFLIITGVVLVCLGRVREKFYPFLILGMSTAMVLMTSLAGPFLVGMDIRLEYFYAQYYSGMDVLPPLLGTPQGTTVANTILAPLLGHVVPLLWVYKLVYPLLLAAIPVMAYLIFRNWFTAKHSFLGAFVLISFPAFFMELPTVIRHITSEFVIVVMLFLIIKSTLPRKYRIPLVVLCGALASLCYYTVTAICLALLGVAFIVSLFIKHNRLLLGVGMAAAIITGVIYYPLADNEAVYRKLAYLYNAYVPEKFEINAPQPEAPRPVTLRTGAVVVNSEEADEPRQEVGTSRGVVVTTKPPDVWKASPVPYYKRLGPLMRTGMGLDWLEQNLWSRLFRVFQWLFMLLVPIGLWRVRKNKKYLMFASGGVFLLALILIPGVPGLLSLTRIVHLSLLVLAPAMAVALKPKYLILILIPYFLFSSGFVFEATKQPNIEEVTMPYSYFLSNDRIDLGIGASITKDDLQVRQYIYDNALYPVTSDIQGAGFMGEVVGWRSTWHRAFRTWLGAEAEKGNYVFVTSRAAKDGLFTLWSAAGCRERVTPESLGIDINENIIYQVNDARVIQVP